MKNAILTIGVVLLLVGLVGLVLSQFSVLWMWALVIAGIIMVVWMGLSKKDKDAIKKQV